MNVAIIIGLICFAVVAWFSEYLRPSSSTLRKKYPELNELHLDEGTMTYLDKGEGHRVVVLIHGYSSCYRCWDETSAYFLSKGYRVIVPELFGNGYSDKKDSFEYSVDFYVSQISRFIASLNLQSFDLVGHSMGGVIAIKTASLFKDQVTKLVLIASTGFGVMKGRNILMNLSVFRPLLQALFFFRPGFIVEFSIRYTALTLTLSKDRSYFKQFAEVINSRGYAHMFFSLARSIDDPQWDQISTASTLPMPVLLLHGNRDKIVPWHGSFILHRYIPNSTIVIIDRGQHSLMETDTEEFTRVLDSFL